MSKKRTKKQKQSAKHTFTIKWEPSTLEAKFSSSVKGQNNNKSKVESSNLSQHKNTIKSEQTDRELQIKGRIIKSLILAGLILGTELVIYFYWN